MTSVFSNNPFKNPRKQLFRVLWGKTLKGYLFSFLFLGGPKNPCYIPRKLPPLRLRHFGCGPSHTLAFFFGGKFLQNPPPNPGFFGSQSENSSFLVKQILETQNLSIQTCGNCASMVLSGLRISCNTTLNTESTTHWLNRNEFGYELLGKEGAGSLISSNFSPKTNLSFSEKVHYFFRWDFFTTHEWRICASRPFPRSF